MAGARIVAMIADENARAFAEDCAPARAEGEGPPLHATAEMRRLATPWSVSHARATLLAELDLPPGILLDPACGSGAQLAAMCTVLGRPGLGIELSGAVAPLAAVNLARVAAWAEGAWGGSSRVFWGDGTEASAIVSTLHETLGAKPPIALLHIDPARPQDAQRHTLDEMQPALDVLLGAWAPHLPPSPALILDLSPRLSDVQRAEVESIVTGLWPDLPIHWQWMTQGRGRIDRLSLWTGAVAASDAARLLRLDRDGGLTEISGVSEESTRSALDPAPGLHLTIVDPSLLASGLAESWRQNVCSEGASGWAVLEGRRPVLLSANPISRDVETDAFLRITGEILEAVESVEFEAVDHLCERATSADLSSIKLRCTVDPDIQPKLQSALDRPMNRHGGLGAPGFIAEVGTAHFLCREHL